MRADNGAYVGSQISANETYVRAVNHQKQLLLGAQNSGLDICGVCPRTPTMISCPATEKAVLGYQLALGTTGIKDAALA